MAVWAEDDLQALPLCRPAWNSRPLGLASQEPQLSRKWRLQSSGPSPVSDRHGAWKDDGTTDQQSQGVHGSQRYRQRKPQLKRTPLGESRNGPRSWGVNFEEIYIVVPSLDQPVLKPALCSLVEAEALFIISKLFIYFAGLSDPFLDMGDG